MMTVQSDSFVISNLLSEDVLRIEPIDEVSLLLAVDEDGARASVVLTPKDAAKLCDWLIAWLNSDNEQAVPA